MEWGGPAGHPRGSCRRAGIDRVLAGSWETSVGVVTLPNSSNCHLGQVIKYPGSSGPLMVTRPESRSVLERRLDEMHADLCKVFSNPVRVGLLVILKDGEKSVGSLARALHVSVPTASKHLRLMRERGVLETRRTGNVVYYRVTSAKVLRAFSLLREVLMARMKETKRLLGHSEE